MHRTRTEDLEADRFDLSTVARGLGVPDDLRVGGTDGQLVAVSSKKSIMVISLVNQAVQEHRKLPTQRSHQRVHIAWQGGSGGSGGAEAMRVGSSAARAGGGFGGQPLLASSLRNEVLIWDIHQLRELYRLGGHTGSVSGIGWAPVQHHVMATCSSDSTVKLWDVRSPTSAVQTLTAAGLPPAFVIAWNRCNGSQIASAHESQLWIWDVRGGTGGIGQGDATASASQGSSAGVAGLGLAGNASTAGGGC